MTARVTGTPRRRPPTPTPPVVLQSLSPTDDKIVALTWSSSGNYLAAGIAQGRILLFATLRTPPVALRASAVRNWRGHTADVLHLQFSSTDFLASASMDRTVRLWHPSLAHCLRRIAHADMVTSVAFHPADDNLLLSAGCDGVCRVWRLSEQAVVAQRVVGAVLTSAVFAADGTAVVGTYDGRCVAATGAALAGASATPADLLDLRKSRGKRQVNGPKVCAVLQRDDGCLTVVCADGRVHVVDGAKVILRARSPVSKKAAWLGQSMTHDGAFVLLDGVFGSVRIADVRDRRAAADPAVKRRDKEVAANVLSLQVVDGGAVSCAAFANPAVIRRCGLGDPVRGRSFFMAVGGDDGSLRIIEQAFERHGNCVWESV